MERERERERESEIERKRERESDGERETEREKESGVCVCQRVSLPCMFSVFYLALRVTAPQVDLPMKNMLQRMS